jgi:WD40 repeat protein
MIQTDEGKDKENQGNLARAMQVLLARAVGFPRPVRDVAFSPDGKWLATAEDSGVWAWNVETKEALTSAPLLPADGARRVAFLSPVGPGSTGPLIAAAVGPTVQLVDANGRTVAEARHRPDAPVTALAVGRGGRWLASGDADGGVRVWEVTADGGVRLVPRAEGQRHTEAVTALAFTRDGRSLVSGSRDRTAVLSDPTTGQERATLTGHPDALVAAAVLPADAGLVTVGRDGALRRWRADPHKPDRTPAVFQSPTGAKMGVGGGS